MNGWKTPVNKTFIDKNNGFTLIEVLMSVAVISIVSVALLQMFSVSIKTNRSAYKMDKANALCVETAELFKGNPAPEPSSMVYFRLTPKEDGTVYTQYLDAQWSNPNPDRNPLLSQVYELKADVTCVKAADTAMSVGYYPEAAFEANLTGEVNLSMTRLGSADCEINIGGAVYSVEESKIIFTGATAMVPIHLHCEMLEETPVHVNVTNRAGTLTYDHAGSEPAEVDVIADIYLCDIPDEINVQVEAEEGISTENRITTKAQVPVEYTALITVTRISDGLVMAQNMVEKYWVESK